MTATLKTWARRYWIVFAGYALAQTIFAVEIYRVGREVATRQVTAQATASASEASRRCEATLRDCSDSVRDLSQSLAKATDGLADCAAKKPCCQVRVEASR